MAEEAGRNGVAQLAADGEISHAQFRALANSMPNLAWMADPEGWIFWYNRRWYEYTGTTPEEMVGWGWQAVHHPDVLPEMLRRWTAALATGEPFEMTFPLRRGSDGSFRIFVTRAEPLREDGRIVGWLGTNTDITELERTRERLQMVVNELNHRVKNTLATVHSIAAQSFRGSDRAAFDSFETRLMALAAVHDLLTRESWSGASLGELVAVSTAFAGHAVEAAGPDAMLVPRIASALAMTLHELATNAVKHGALTVPTGKVSLGWQIEAGEGCSILALHWEESGGPPVTPPVQEGFGLKLVRRLATGERGAAIDLDFAPTGLRCYLRLPFPAAGGRHAP